MSVPAPTALVGAGFIAEVHADALRRLPGVRVSAVVDRDEIAPHQLTPVGKA